MLTTLLLTFLATLLLVLCFLVLWPRSTRRKRKHTPRRKTILKPETKRTARTKTTRSQRHDNRSKEGSESNERRSSSCCKSESESNDSCFVERIIKLAGPQGAQGPTGIQGIDFYTTDGALTSDRTVDLAGNVLIFENGGEVQINGKLTVTGLIDPTSLVLTESRSSALPVPPDSGGFYVSDGSDGELQNYPIYKFASGATANLIQNEGTQGFQGPNGLQGAITLTINGLQGYIGEMGALGSQGVQGVAGVVGNVGTQGSQGLDGVQGGISSGITGAQGNQGVQSASGVQGMQGDIGVQGRGGDLAFDGTQGAQGFEGLQGAIGYQAPVGEVGQVGTQGIQGEVGYEGYQGNQGVPGINGLGAMGLQGVAGLGIQGKQGVQGLEQIGENGLVGIQGLQGVQGSAGVQGFDGAGGSSLPTVTQASDLMLDRTSAVVTGFPSVMVFPEYMVHRATFTSVVGQNDFFTCPAGRRAILLGSVGQSTSAYSHTLYWKGTDLVYRPLSSLQAIGANQPNRFWHSMFVLEAGESYSLNLTILGVSVLATIISFDAANPISPRTARVALTTVPTVLWTGNAGKTTYGLSTQFPNVKLNLISPTTVMNLIIEIINFTGANTTTTATITPFGNTAKTDNVILLGTNTADFSATGWVLFPGDIITVSSTTNTAGQYAYTTLLEL